jgi:hypothetical protein
MESPPHWFNIELTCLTTGRWLDRFWARREALLVLAFALCHFAPFRAAWSEFPWGAALKPLLAATRMRLAAVKFSAQVGRLNAVAVTPNTASQAMDSAS